MTAYAVGHLRNVSIGPDIVEYLRRIDDTLAPFGGHFIIHGARPQVKEGNWQGDLVVIAFAELADAEAWYESDAFEAIKPLRSNNAEGEILLIDGVDAAHKATDILAGITL